MRKKRNAKKVTTKVKEKKVQKKHFNVKQIQAGGQGAFTLSTFQRVGALWRSAFTRAFAQVVVTFLQDTALIVTVDDT